MVDLGSKPIRHAPGGPILRAISGLASTMLAARLAKEAKDSNKRQSSTTPSILKRRKRPPGRFFAAGARDLLDQCTNVP